MTSARTETVVTLATGVLLGFLASVAGDVLASREAERDRVSVTPARSSDLPWQDAQLFAEVLERVKREYVEPVDDRQLIDGAVRGLVSGLDPYSAYLDQDESRLRRPTMPFELLGPSKGRPPREQGCAQAI
jgi:carboxyl-terminal processing protease